MTLAASSSPASERQRATTLPRVLVVDDEMGVRESLRAILQNECEVLTATSGDEALAIVGRESIDIMTLDLKMPGMGGINVLERVKQIDPDIEVLIITGYGSLDTAVQGIRFRAFDYLPKPFDYTHVRRLIQMAAARRVAMRRMKNGPEQLLSTLSHELRTPLNVIMGYSNMLKDESTGSLSEDQQMALDRIQANSTSLLAYVEAIFYMAELDRGTCPLAVAPTNISNVFGQIGAELGPRALEKGLTWRLDAPIDLTVGTDEDKLVRLLRALGDNAVRFTTHGEIAIVARPTAAAVAIEVRDSGPGLAPELIAEVEDVMNGRNAQRPPRQLGFGLRLVGRLVRALGASMTFATSPTGTTCSILVPDLTETGRSAQAASA